MKDAHDKQCDWLENFTYVVLSGSELQSQSKQGDIDTMKHFVDIVTNCGGYLP